MEHHNEIKFLREMVAKERKGKKVSLILVFILFIAYSSQLFLLNEADNDMRQLEFDLNVSDTALMICKSKYERLSKENKDLRKANQCLLDYSNSDCCIITIKYTKLPKLVKEK